MKVQIEDLRALVLLGDGLSLSNIALYTSQNIGMIKRRLERIEDVVGFEVYTRSSIDGPKTRSQLTQEGWSLYEGYKEILDLWDSLHSS